MAEKRKSSMFSDVDYSFTVMLLGDSCTGKTCLLIRFKDNTFMNNNFISTVGIDYRNKLVDLDRNRVKLQVWDTAGQERFRSLTSTYYRDADALLLVYDVTNRNSFENIRDWLAQVKEYAKESVELMLVGNKTDLGHQRRVRAEEGRQLAKAYNIGFMETSAKSGQNVHEVFRELSRRLVAAAQTDGTVGDRTRTGPELCCKGDEEGKERTKGRSWRMWGLGGWGAGTEATDEGQEQQGTATQQCCGTG